MFFVVRMIPQAADLHGHVHTREYVCVDVIDASIVLLIRRTVPLAYCLIRRLNMYRPRTLGI